MRYTKEHQELRSNIAALVRAARKHSVYDRYDYRRPDVWKTVVCSNGQDCEHMILDSSFDPCDFKQWIAIVESNPENEYRCVTSFETDEWGGEQLNVQLEQLVPASDYQWFNHVSSLRGLGACNESLSTRVYRACGIYLSEKQIAAVVDAVQSKE